MKTGNELMELAKQQHQLDGQKVIRAFFDGACEPVNPGGVATCGWIVYGVHDEILASGSKVVADGNGSTNNVAEYHALGLCLRWLVDNPREAARILIFGDSRLVCEQVDGGWNCNKEHLRKLRDRCRELLGQLRDRCEAVIRWVPREENEAADSLSREAYEKHTGKRFPNRSRR